MYNKRKWKTNRIIHESPVSYFSVFLSLSLYPSIFRVANIYFRSMCASFFVSFHFFLLPLFTPLLFAWIFRCWFPKIRRTGITRRICEIYIDIYVVYLCACTPVYVRHNHTQLPVIKQIRWENGNENIVHYEVTIIKKNNFIYVFFPSCSCYLQIEFTHEQRI